MKSGQRRQGKRINMELYFDRIKTLEDLTLIKYWLEDPELLKMARMRENPLLPDEYQAYLETLSFMVYANDLAIGYVRIFKGDEPEEGELGIVIALPEYKGVGLGTEIGTRLLDTALRSGYKKLNWATADYNLASIKLALKLGFKFYQLIPDVITIGGKKHNALIYRYEVENAV
jgi:RimJ/RimL family protein N-acetyltransferase